MTRVALAAVLAGDVDGNGRVDINDARDITAFRSGVLESLPHPENADVSEDGTIDIRDALAIAQCVSGKSVGQRRGLLYPFCIAIFIQPLIVPIFRWKSEFQEIY